MFKRIHYDQFRNKIHLWETEDGKYSHKEFDFELTYYVRDNSGKSEIKDIYGHSVIKRKAKNLQEIKNVKETKVKCCETDIPVETKFLQEYYFGKDLKVDMSNINICTIDIEVTAPEFPKPEIAKYPIDLVTMHFSQSGRIVTLGLNEYTGNNPLVKEYHWIPDEKLLLEKMIDIFRKEKVDIITGWNVLTFDCLYIVNRCNNLNIEKNFSPLNKYSIKKKKNKNNQMIDVVKFEGLSILDYMDLYKKFTYEARESYSLQNIGMIEIDEGKKDYEGQINDLSQRNWNEYVEYNIQDVLIVVKFENGNPEAKNKKKRAGLKFIELTVNICYQALIPFESVFSQMAVLTGYILKFLHEENMVLPDKERQSKDKLPGAYVYACPGLYKYLTSYDVESEYPMMILEYNIGPDTLVIDPSEEEKKLCYSTPLSEYKTWHLETGETIHVGGIYYRKDKESVLKKIVSKIFNERKMFKKKMFEARDSGNKDLEKYYKSQQLIRKILINSMYGVLGNQHFHLYNNNCAMTITLSGQELIKYLSETINDYFMNYFYQNTKYFPIEDENNKLKNNVVKLTDTDSCYLCFEELFEKLNLKFESDLDYVKWMNEFDKDVIKPFLNDILNIYASRYGIPQLINFKREKIITGMIILAKKKYVTQIKDKEGEIFDDLLTDVTGIEIIKTSTPKFCRDALLELVKKMFVINDKEIITNEIMKIKKMFKDQNITDISFPRGVSEYTEYAKDTEYYLKRGLTYPSGCPYHVRASMNYNYTITKYNMKLLPISNGSKIRFIYLKPNNFLKQDIIAWIGEYPKEFNELFNVDYDLQFEKSFLTIIQRFYEVMGWGEINLQNSKMKKFIIK